MTALVAVEAACILLLGLLVVGLLRSHAEILRQLHDLGAGREDNAGAGPVPVDLAAANGPTGSPSHDLGGQAPDGEAVAVAVTGTSHDTVLAFLSSGCLTCAGFWEALRTPGELGLPANTRIVAITKSPGDESAATVGQLAAGGRTVVMSTEAWLAYGVPGSPYFVHVDGASGRVVGEGTAGTWEQVVSLVARATEDRLAGRAAPGPPGHGRDHRDASRIDQDLMAAGIVPGDATLYPVSPPVSGDEQ